MANTTTTTHSTGRSAARTGEMISSITALGHRVLRYGLALVIGWIGTMKFTGYEAQGIEPLVAHSPLLGWMYRIWTVPQFAAAGRSLDFMTLWTAIPPCLPARTEYTAMRAGLRHCIGDFGDAC